MLKKIMILKCFKLPRKNIALVQFIIEGYEGFSTVTTVDSHKAVICISIMADYFQEMLKIIESLKDKYEMQEMIAIERL
jgi:hypothetical protein